MYLIASYGGTVSQYRIPVQSRRDAESAARDVERGRGARNFEKELLKGTLKALCGQCRLLMLSHIATLLLAWLLLASAALLLSLHPFPTPGRESHGRSLFRSCHLLLLPFLRPCCCCCPTLSESCHPFATEKTGGRVDNVMVLFAT